MYFGKENRHLHAIHCNSIAIHRDGGWGWWGITKWRANRSSKQKTDIQMASIGAIFNFTYVSQKAAKSMAKLTSQSCDDLRLVVQGRWSYLKTTQALVDI